MKVAAFHGSPRIGGNSDILLEEAIKAVKGEGHEVIKFRPSQMNFSPCISCGRCNKTGLCAVRDDMIEIYKAILESDRFIIASPVYFFNLPAQLKSLIDRSQCFWVEKYVLKKEISPGSYGRKGFFILVSALQKNNPVKCCKSVIKAFFNTISVSEFDTLVYTGVDEKGEIKKHPEFLEEVCRAARNLVKTG